MVRRDLGRAIKQVAVAEDPYRNGDGQRRPSYQTESCFLSCTVLFGRIKIRKIWEAISRPEYSENLRDDVSSKFLARIIHEPFYRNRGFAAATSLDAAGPASSHAGSPFGGQQTVSSMLPSLTTSRACLARRRGDFATNRRE